MKSKEFDNKLKIALGVKEKPSMTINKLGEFLIANPHRQRRILQQLKFPKESQYGFAKEYTIAKDAIKSFLINDYDFDILEKALRVLDDRVPKNDWQAGMIASAVDSIELVQERDFTNMGDYSFETYKGDNPKLDISGVEVSVYPDLIVRSNLRKENCIGAMKIHITKNNKLNEQGSQYVAAMLYYFIEKNEIKTSEILKHKLCISYDVFSESLIECPKSVKRRWDDIDAGCRNIMAIWSSIEKP